MEPLCVFVAPHKDSESIPNKIAQPRDRRMFIHLF